MAKIAISNGSFQDGEGNSLAGGQLILQLNTDAVVVGTGQIISQLPVAITLDSSGNAPSTSIWFNDQLSPSGTVYIARLFSADGQAVWAAAQNWSFTGSSAINLDTMLPTSQSVSYSNPIITTPSADQTISADNLLPASGNTSQSLGLTGGSVECGAEHLVRVGASIFSAVPANGVRFTPTGNTAGTTAIYGTNAANNATTWSLDQAGNLSCDGVALASKITTYNNISTAGNGVASEVNQIVATGLTAEL